MRPAKIQNSLCSRTVWSESSMGTFWIAKAAKFLHADNEDFDQTARIARRTCAKIRLWRFGWYIITTCFFFLFCFCKQIGDVMKKWLSWYMRTAKARSDCASAQSDQGLSCPFTNYWILQTASNSRVPIRLSGVPTDLGLRICLRHLFSRAGRFKRGNYLLSMIRLWKLTVLIIQLL